jgi:hypothetical protein
MRIGLLTLACLAACPIRAQIETGNRFSVQVGNSVTGTPISGANVVLERVNDKLLGKTDAGGVFTGRTHFAGNYLLTVTRKGYRMTGTGIMGKMVEVKAGANMEVRVDMLPLGVLAGRVLDQYGDPVRHAIVSTQDKPSAPGQDQYYGSNWAATTDDRGEYRITGVEPGMHYLAVEYSSTKDERSSAPRSSYRWPQTEGLVLYPNASDLDQAQPVEAAAGRTTRVNDVNLKIERPLTISGRVKPRPVEESQSVSLQRVAKLALHTSAMIRGAGTEADGSFKIDVLPGSYVLTAADAKTGKSSKSITVEVRDKNVSDVELELTLNYDISGRFMIDGPERIDLSKLLLNFGGSLVKIDGGGAFETKLPGGKAFYMLQGLPEDWYLEELRVAGKRIMGRQFEIEPGRTDVVLTLCPRGSRVEITLEGAGSRFDAVFVTLLPESGRVPDVESVLQAKPDGSGKFIARSVPPGSYRVFTLDASNWALLYRPDALLEKYRTAAPLINIAAGETKSIIVPVSKIQPQ